ncbi:hypothetical protein KL86PLE_30007 [uncultured Pleomorphomonas sp.]|uniref:Uncharacterized protein n=1 Tax=uncultured Pleomorphomonas sp. TaxID=442121 RepID=A0A212LDI1_9HYPH|nr:hypothetical protein [uncultured Pleomorphomonas sp.]SCM75560.1 hypothetical protein KL86PLE_30007 [uncultured Pleomorphomonas sp.]
MDERAAVTDKAETFLRGLTPRARGMLVRRLESDRAVPGEIDARRRLILEAARAIAASRGAAKQATAGGVPDMRRLVFGAFEPYVIEERLTFPARGFVTAATLSHLWAYACTELLPAEFAVWNDPSAAPPPTDEAARRAEAARLEACLFEVLARHVEAIADEPKRQQRFMSRIGGEVARQEVDDMIAVRDRLDDLPTLSAAIVHLLDSGPLDMGLLEQIAAYLAKYPHTAGWVAGGVFRRQSSAASLIAFAKLLAQGETARHIRATPAAAAFVDLGFAAADRAASRFLTILRSGRNAADAVRQIGVFRSVLNELAVGLDVDGDGWWQQRMIVIKRRFSEMLFAEFDKLLPAMRRAFRMQETPHPGPADGAEALFLCAVFAAAGKSRDTLAIHGLIGRLTPLVDQAMELYALDLPTRLRSLDGEARAAALSAVDHLIKAAGFLYGEDYASHLRRSREQQLKAARPAA